MKRRTPLTARRGAFTVEFALTVPIVFLLVLSFIEFSHILMLDSSAENAVYEGARAAIVPGGTSSDARNATQGILDAVRANNYVITITPATVTDATSEITVAVEIPVNGNLWIPNAFSQNLVLRHTCTLRRERTTVATP
jgi:Flp pilus assembly protein TadG